VTQLCSRRFPCSCEPLEPRQHFSSSFPNINIAPMTGNEAEGAIAVDPADPSRVFAVVNVDTADQQLAAISNDGGATWTERSITNGADGLPQACCDASAAFDPFGNLFVTYLSVAKNAVIVLTSTDGGQDFKTLARYQAKFVDEPTITTGPGAVWLTFNRNQSIVVTGAADTGLGAVAGFFAPQALRGSTNGNFGDIAVGPSGQVVVTYQVQLSPKLSNIYVNTDPTGLVKPRFGKPILATTTRAPAFDYIPAMPDWGVDAEAGLAFDRSGGPFNGRIYVAYTDEFPAASGNTEILLRYSDNGGAAWSQPIRVNDDATLNSKFLPRIALDQTTGNVAVSWYDSRNDLGNHGPGDTDGIANDDAEYFATLVTPQAGGLVVSPSQQISAGVSNSRDASSSIDFGDYSGLDFFAGTMHPLWFDNSNSTGDNPNGILGALNAYTANVPSSAFATGGQISLGGTAAVTGPLAALSFASGANVGYATKGSGYTITVRYADSTGINRASIAGGNLLITGPNGFSASPQQVRLRPQGRALLATYTLANPAGAWGTIDDGEYTIVLQPGQVLNGAGTASSGGILGSFAVSIHGTSHRQGSGTGFRAT
jgi:hypothetical protein